MCGIYLHVKGRKHAFDAWYTSSIYDLYCLVMLFGFVIWREKKKKPHYCLLGPSPTSRFLQLKKSEHIPLDLCLMPTPHKKN